MKKTVPIIGSLLLTAVSSPAADRSPNVLFICVDDLRPQLGCYGNEQMKTPNIDRLAGRSTLFQRAYCQFAICGPSRASVLSGMYPEHSGAQDNVKSFRAVVPDAVALPQHFRSHGYETVGMGKVFHHMANTDPASWNRWVNITGRGYFLPENIAEQKKRQQSIAAREAAGEKFSEHQKYVYTVGPFSEAADADENLYPDGELAAKAVETLRGFQGSEKPWFMAVGFLKPHLPLIVPKKYWDLYNPADFTLPANGEFPVGSPACHTHDSFELRSYSDVPKNGPISKEILRRTIHGYYAACSFADAQVGKVLDELTALGMESNTVIVLWGDNGFHLGDNGIIGKDTDYEAAARCPLMVCAPSMTPERTDRLVELVDIFPTLCGLAGIPVPPQCDGRNLFAKDRKNAAFTMSQRKWNNPNAGYAMRTDQYRYIRWIDAQNKTVAEELYDYTLNPYEVRNLTDDPEYKAVRDSLRKQFDAGSPIARQRIKDFSAVAVHERSVQPSLNAVFTDHMILQRNMPVPVYGTAAPRQTVTVEFAGQKKTGEADALGNWMIKLDPMGASSNPAVLTVAFQGSGLKRQISDVLVGDVWLCGGQSNMASVMENYPALKNEIPLMRNPEVRLLKIKHAGVGSPVPSDAVVVDEIFRGSWQPMMPDFAAPFSATACFFGRKLWQETGVPIGLLYANRGGTQVNMWLPMKAMDGRGAYTRFLGADNPEWKARTDNPDSIRAPSYLYNGTIHPLIRFAVRGVIWYQGESDAYHPADYPSMFKDLIEAWRQAWGYELPFLFVQLPGYGAVAWDNSGEAWAWLREAQTSALKLPGTGMAVAIDLGEYGNIHPQNKGPVGERLALLAESLDNPEIQARSPMYKTVRFEGGKAGVVFSDVGSGLVARRVAFGGTPSVAVEADSLEGFLICGPDRRFVKACAEIAGIDTVRVWSDQVKAPVAVRYGWSNFPLCNLYNSAGLPAAPFRTDDFPMPSPGAPPAVDDTEFSIAKPEVSFSADFSRNPLDGWQKSRPGLDATISSGMLAMYCPTEKNTVFYTPQAGTGDHERFSVEADLEGCRPQAWGGVAFNYLSPDDFYVVRICAGTAQSQFIHYRNGNPLVLEKVESPVAFEAGKAYRIKVRGARAGSFEIDGLYKFEICDVSNGRTLVSRIKRDSGSATFGGSAGCYLGMPSAGPLFKYSRFVFSAGE